MLPRILAAAYGTILGLKVADIIAAPWWLVLMPVWVPLALFLTALVCIGLALAVVDMRGRE